MLHVSMRIGNSGHEGVDAGSGSKSDSVLQELTSKFMAKLSGSSDGQDPEIKMPMLTGTGGVLPHGEVTEGPLKIDPSSVLPSTTTGTPVQSNGLPRFTEGVPMRSDPRPVPLGGTTGTSSGISPGPAMFPAVTGGGVLAQLFNMAKGFTAQLGNDVQTDSDNGVGNQTPALGAVKAGLSNLSQLSGDVGSDMKAGIGAVLGTVLGRVGAGD